VVRDDFGEEFAREEDARTHPARVASELARNKLDQSMSGQHLIGWINLGSYRFRRIDS
jgi:hypothetical protein